MLSAPTVFKKYWVSLEHNLSPGAPKNLITSKIRLHLWGKRFVISALRSIS
jgi:hypothetical protein